MRLYVMALALIAAMSAPVWAEDTPENIVKYRKDYMTALGGHVGAIFKLLKAITPRPSI